MLSLKLYRAMLKLYPATFRENYAGPLEREFLDEYGEAPNRMAVAGLWMRTLADFSTAMPVILLREITEDARHALRQWRKRPLPILMAIAALAIGIGANIGVFSVIDALMLRSLPFREPERLVIMHGYAPVGSDSTPAKFRAWMKHNNFMDNAANYFPLEANLESGGNSARIQMTETTANFFDLMGIPARAGRTFDMSEDEKGHDGVVVIGYGLWQQLFAGEPHALGSTIHINGEPMTIIGVAPPGFDYPNRSQLWTPTIFDVEKISKTGVFYFQPVGRMRQGMTLPQVRAAFQAEAKAHDPKSFEGGPDDWPSITPLRDEIAGSLKQESLILSVVVGLLLLIACANVANLLLSRTADRVNELAIRSALGASRARLIQQLLTESILLSAAGAVASLLVAEWAVRMASIFQPAGTASQAYSLADWRVFAFAIALALFTGLLFGAAPALFASSSLIRSNSPRRFTSRLRASLMAVQIGLTVVLIAGSASLGYAFLKLMSSDKGFQTGNLISLGVSLNDARYAKKEAKQQFAADAVQKLRAIDGVTSVASSQYVPLSTNGFYMLFGFHLDRGKDQTGVALPVSSEFFSTMGVPMVYGRGFTEADSRGTEKVIVISESLARSLSPNPQTLIGQQLVSSGTPWTPARIVGIARDMHYHGPGGGAWRQAFPLVNSVTNFVVRVDGNDPRSKMAAIRDAVQSVDPRIPVHDVTTMDDRLTEVIARPRFYALATVLFGCCALLLTIIGLYGMFTYSVAQRTREMGIRMALGSTASSLRLMLLRHGLILVAVGAIPGIIASLFAAQWLEQLVAGANSVTSAACFASLIPIAAIAGFSIWRATSRISSLDPSAALRVE